ncbi:hypothetical protein MAY22_01085, partial [Escherichia coli]
VPAYGPQNDVTLKMPAFEWVHVQLHQQKGMISLSPPTICNSAFFSDVSDAPGACQAITDMIYSSQVATPDNMELMYQLYALASRKPLLKTVMQNWMQRSQQTLEQWFEPGTARALDAFIEGMTLHFVTDRKPLSREEILRMVERVAG